ncbi:hypothetical protein Csa_011352 [Cucumis sativus]|uniref:Uncharacterized protein n=1 Tax=Cucumis sativus TaxID=3659 RepID=A0A0A0L994_CUCSA|nr:hypothetical protein Csa_011352 [Cucumis sativus]
MFPIFLILKNWAEIVSTAQLADELLNRAQFSAQIQLSKAHFRNNMPICQNVVFLLDHTKQSPVRSSFPPLSPAFTLQLLAVRRVIADHTARWNGIR